MQRQTVAASLLLTTAALACITLAHTIPVLGNTAYNPQTAAHFLDDRETWWQDWPHAQRDHGTVCISCHTQVPYAMVRPALQHSLGEAALPAINQAMLTGIERRVNFWPDMITFYTDAKSGPGKTVESRATEAVLNAIILAGQDSHLQRLRPVTRTAFEEAWALQESTGALAGSWKWQNFHLGPWEGEESGYQGTALLLVEAVNAPGGYAKEPAVRPHLAAMAAYLRREYAAQPLLNQLYVLWASRRQPGLLTAEDREKLLAALQAAQLPDGGWATSALDQRERKDHSPAPTAGDGYATGVIVLALEETGTRKHDPISNDDMLRRGLAWLAGNQQPDGTWTAASINKQRDPHSDAALFMTDAATAYAVLALQTAR